MNYLQDRHLRRKRYFKWGGFIFVAIFLFYFWAPFFGVFAGVSHAIFRPALIAGNVIGGKFSSIFSYFKSKGRLESENSDLKSQLASMSAKMADYNVLEDENAKLKEILERKPEGVKLLLSAILSKPNKSLYDTLIIDRGTNHGIQVGQRVFALGNVPIGKISEVYNNSANVVLFSSGSEVTEGVITEKDIFIEAVGRGGGSFEILLPRDLELSMGTEVTLPGIPPRVFGIIEKVISEPRDAFQKVLMRSPVNIFELKFVEVEI